jgi:cytoskeletal protein RodZ
VGAFGDKFRKERERRGFTLDDVSNVTKINSRMLKAIEEEHFDLLPGGVFNKGFVRAYAKHLGFNDEESISEYLLALRQAQVDAQIAAWQTDVPPRTEPRRPEQIRLEQPRGKPRDEKAQSEKIRVEQKPDLPAVKVPNKSVLDEDKPGIKPEVKHTVKPEVKREVTQNTLPPQKTPESAPAQAEPVTQKNPSGPLPLGNSLPRPASIPWKVPAVALAVILVAAVLWNRHSRGVQAEGAVTASARNTAISSSSSSNSVLSPTATTPAATPQRNATPDHSAGQAVPDPDVTSRDVSDRDIPPRKLHNAPAAAKAPPLFTLRIRASETTWIAVAADGQPETRETLIAPASTYIRATREITVRVGNAAGVRFLLNGKEIPPQGAESEVKTFTFDSAGMKEDSHSTASDQ